MFFHAMRFERKEDAKKAAAVVVSQCLLKEKNSLPPSIAKVDMGDSFYHFDVGWSTQYELTRKLQLAIVNEAYPYAYQFNERKNVLSENEDQTTTAEQKTTTERTTGPLDNLAKKARNAWENISGRKGEPKDDTGHERPGHEKSAIEKMRDKIADMDEDYKDAGERILGFFVQLVGYLGPFLLMIWIGSDLGKYFAPVMDPVPAYGLSYTIEGIIAACTVSMGRGFAEIASGRGAYGKVITVVLIWLTLNASSAFGLYLVITHNGNVSGVEQFSMVIRVCAIALGDLGCSSVLMFKGRSLQRHIDSIRKRATAIGELADAQRGIEEADKNAALREQMMKATLQIQEDLSAKIGDAVSMVMTSILEKMEKALKDDDQGRNERGYGRR